MSKASELGRGGETTTTCTLGSREETLKLAPVWGAGIGGEGAGLRKGAWKKRRENEGGRLVEEVEFW